jgi:serine/threonine protein phosphatase PrpC
LNASDYHIAIGNATDVGKIRERNEDYMAHFDTPFGYCIIICDGMGGHAAGEVASQNAVVAIRQYLQDKENENEAITVAMKNAIEFANFQLREMMNKNPALKGMGTTCVLALIKDGQLYISHAGDSRLYLIRNGNADYITKDHSSVQKLIDSGVLTEEEAELSDKKNQISKAIGVFEKVDPAITESPVILQKDDKLLLCSDGLTGHVTRKKILETLSAEDNVQNLSLKLVELANTGGGSDNITVQVVHFTGNTIMNDKKPVALKSLAIVVLLIAGLLLGFIGYMKNENSGNQKPVSKDTNTIMEEKKPDTGTEKIKPIPDTAANDINKALLFDSVRKKWYMKDP